MFEEIKTLFGTLDSRIKNGIIVSNITKQKQPCHAISLEAAK